jgi:uncharacterized membrane protein YhhN
MRGDARVLAAIGVGFGLFYPLLWAIPAPLWALIVAKGAGVGFLALAAARSARGVDGWLLAIVLALGASGDILLEVDFAAGAAAFALGHAVAILLYLRNRRPAAGAVDVGVAALLLALAVGGPWFLLQGRQEQTAFAAYGLLLGAMAASAWLSRFPRKVVAAGALLFVISDLLIAARMGMEARPAALGLAIWYLYFTGQVLVYLGVSGDLSRRKTPHPASPKLAEEAR